MNGNNCLCVYLYFIYMAGYIGGKLLSVDAVANRTISELKCMEYCVMVAAKSSHTDSRMGTETVACQWFGVAIINCIYVYTTKQPNENQIWKRKMAAGSTI